MLKTKPIQNLLNKFHKAFPQPSLDQNQNLHHHNNRRQQGRSVPAAASNHIPAPLLSPGQSNHPTNTTTIITTLEGKQYKVTISFQGHTMLSYSIVPVPTFEEMVNSYRSKPQCLTLNEIDQLFLEHRYTGQNNNGYPHEECSICLMGFTPGESTYQLPCSHIYHKNCIVSWVLHRNGNCPLCKKHFRYDNH